MADIGRETTLPDGSPGVRSDEALDRERIDDFNRRMADAHAQVEETVRVFVPQVYRTPIPPRPGY